jgi:type II secretory pathway pseudopilin PulG
MNIDGKKRILKKPGQASFTILELLFVIGIMALLAAVSAPAYSEIARSMNMRTAQNQIRSGLYAARQQAVTLRSPVYFGVPVSTTTLGRPYVRDDMLFRSFVLYTKEAGGVSRLQTVLGKVEQLPKNIIFDPEWIGDATSTNSSIWKLDEVRDGSGQNRLFRVRYVRYSPLGNLHWKDYGPVFSTNTATVRAPKIVLIEGEVTPSGVPIPRKSANPMSSTNSINLYTGRLLEN